VASGWNRPFETLRRKWAEIPLSDRRERSSRLLELSDEELLATWRRHRALDDTLNRRGWYRLLYADTMPGKRLLDIGCGFAYDSLTFAEAGADVTLVDIVEDNVALAGRVAALLGLDVRLHYMQDVASLEELPHDYDVVLAIGSLHNAPRHVMRPEYEALARRLRAGGRWLQLAYPKSRWLRDGALPFDEWASKVDGAGTPWEEWLDVEALIGLLAPVRFELVFYCEWHDGDFNWFDLQRMK
jgi:SAM-dependent methyltransferase